MSEDSPEGTSCRGGFLILFSLDFTAATFALGLRGLILNDSLVVRDMSLVPITRRTHFPSLSQNNKAEVQ